MVENVLDYEDLMAQIRDQHRRIMENQPRWDAMKLKVSVQLPSEEWRDVLATAPQEYRLYPTPLHELAGASFVIKAVIDRPSGALIKAAFNGPGGGVTITQVPGNAASIEVETVESTKLEG